MSAMRLRLQEILADAVRRETGGRAGIEIGSKVAFGTDAGMMKQPTSGEFVTSLNGRFGTALVIENYLRKAYRWFA